MKRIYFPLIALGLGLIGFFLRMQQLSVALSPSTGMPILHHPYSYALIALTIVGVLLLFFLSFFVANEAQDRYSAYHADPPLQGLEFLSAAAFLVGTGMICRTLFLTYQKQRRRQFFGGALSDPAISPISRNPVPLRHGGHPLYGSAQRGQRQLVSGAVDPRLYVLRLAAADLSFQRLQPIGHVLRLAGLRRQLRRPGLVLHRLLRLPISPSPSRPPGSAC